MFASKGKNKIFRPRTDAKGDMKMKIFMSRINNQKRVNNAQIATDKDGKILFVRMSLMRKAS